MPIYRAIITFFFNVLQIGGGTDRPIRTAKGRKWFCYHEYIDHEFERIFRTQRRKHLSDTEQFADFVALVRTNRRYLAVHPFREGNVSIARLTFARLFLHCRFAGLLRCRAS